MWQAVIPIIGQVIDKVFPDKTKADEAKLRLMEMQLGQEGKELEANLQIALAQSKVNEVEAASPDNFRGGWRPFAGWVCGVGLAYEFILRPILPWVVAVFGGITVPEMPSIGMDALMSLLFGMLGLGGFRSFEKVKGVN